MKKITFILIALITGTTFAQDASSDSGTATVNAEIVSPITISDGTSLDFGRIIGTALGGTVTVNADDTRTFSNDDMAVPSTTVSAATFTVTAATGYSYSIAIPDVNLTGAGDDMVVEFTSSLGATSSGTGASQDLIVGGTLNVNAAQAQGSYSGDVKVTVAYE